MVFDGLDFQFDGWIPHCLFEFLCLLRIDPPHLWNPRAADRTADVVARTRKRTGRLPEFIPVHDALGRRIPRQSVVVLICHYAVEFFDQCNTLLLIKTLVVL